MLIASSLMLLVVACSPAATPVPPAPGRLSASSASATTAETSRSSPAPVTTSTTSVPALPDGVYSVEHYKLKLIARHYTLLTEFGEEWAQGVFAVQGNRILFTEQDFAPECGPEDSPFSYQWSFDGRALSFSRPDDKCSGRQQLMSERPWVYQTRE